MKLKLKAILLLTLLFASETLASQTQCADSLGMRSTTDFDKLEDCVGKYKDNFAEKVRLMSAEHMMLQTSTETYVTSISVLLRELAFQLSQVSLENYFITPSQENHCYK